MATYVRFEANRSSAGNRSHNGVQISSFSMRGNINIQVSQGTAFPRDCSHTGSNGQRVTNSIFEHGRMPFERLTSDALPHPSRASRDGNQNTHYVERDYPTSNDHIRRFVEVGYGRADTQTQTTQRGTRRRAEAQRAHDEIVDRLAGETINRAPQRRQQRKETERHAQDGARPANQQRNACTATPSAGATRPRAAPEPVSQHVDPQSRAEDSEKEPAEAQRLSDGDRPMGNRQPEKPDRSRNRTDPLKRPTPKKFADSNPSHPTNDHTASSARVRSTQASSGIPASAPRPSTARSTAKPSRAARSKPTRPADDRKSTADKKNLYAPLALSPSASPDEVKKAYHKAALKYHPDKNPSGAEKFQEIAAAYETLSNPERRALYDRTGKC